MFKAFYTKVYDNDVKILGVVKAYFLGYLRYRQEYVERCEENEHDGCFWFFLNGEIVAEKLGISKKTAWEIIGFFKKSGALKMRKNGMLNSFLYSLDFEKVGEILMVFPEKVNSLNKNNEKNQYFENNSNTKMLTHGSSQKNSQIKPSEANEKLTPGANEKLTPPLLKELTKEKRKKDIKTIAKSDFSAASGAQHFSPDVHDPENFLKEKHQTQSKIETEQLEQSQERQNELVRDTNQGEIYKAKPKQKKISDELKKPKKLKEQSQGSLLFEHYSDLYEKLAFYKFTKPQRDMMSNLAAKKLVDKFGLETAKKVVECFLKDFSKKCTEIAHDISFFNHSQKNLSLYNLAIKDGKITTDSILKQIESTFANSSDDVKSLIPDDFQCPFQYTEEEKNRIEKETKVYVLR